MNGTMNGTAPSPFPAEPALLCNPDGSDNLIGLPCSASVLGNLFLMAVYGGLLAFGAERISTGSEKLLEVRISGHLTGSRAVSDVVLSFPSSCPVPQHLAAVSGVVLCRRFERDERRPLLPTVCIDFRVRLSAICWRPEE